MEEDLSSSNSGVVPMGLRVAHPALHRQVQEGGGAVQAHNNGQMRLYVLLETLQQWHGGLQDGAG